MYSLLLSFLKCTLHISAGIPQASPDHHLNVPLTVTLTNMFHFLIGISLPMGISHLCLFFAMISEVHFATLVYDVIIYFLLFLITHQQTGHASYVVSIGNVALKERVDD
jgi:hypothetical protein